MARRLFVVVIIFNHAVEAYLSLFEGQVCAGLSGTPRVCNKISSALFSLHPSSLHRLIEILEFPKNINILVKLDILLSFIAIRM